MIAVSLIHRSAEEFYFFANWFGSLSDLSDKKRNDSVALEGIVTSIEQAFKQTRSVCSRAFQSAMGLVALAFW
jgi:hypothetical protein